MDKITHQVRAEHWTKILNECMNSGMSKTAWCRANGISEKQFFYWQRILRREAYEASQNPSLPCFLQALFGEKCKIFLENVASPNWRKLQGLGWQLFCQLHSHCRPYLVVIA